MPRKAPDHVIRLARPELRKLEDLVNSEYVKSKLTDKAFAEYATQMLKTQINPSHIAGAREVFGMISNRDAQREVGKVCNGTAMSRLSELEEQVRVLTNRVNMVHDRMMRGL